MQKALFILFLIFFVNANCFAQKITQEVISAYEIEEIYIHTAKIFQLNIFSTTDNFIKVETKMEGEYYRDIKVTTVTKNKQLRLSCELAEGFQLPNDKLSAHKVFSITMNVYIPQRLKVQIEGDETQVHITGNYKKIWAALISGSYIIDDFQAEAKILTKKGNIQFVNKKPFVFEVKSEQQLIYYEKGKKVELQATNGKIIYSSNKG